MNARFLNLGGTRRLPAIVLVARREVRMRLRSRVFVGGSIVMAVLVVVGIVAASLLAGKTNPARVGFSGGSQALEGSFTATAAALGMPVTISDIADVDAGEAQITAGTLDVRRDRILRHGRRRRRGTSYEHVERAGRYLCLPRVDIGDVADRHVRTQGRGRRRERTLERL